MIDLQAITKRYSSKTPFGVTDIHFSIGKNEIISLIGPSGSGKSTLLNIVAGTLEADQGKILKKEGLRISLLKSSEVIKNDQTIFEYLMSQIDDPISIEQKINAVRSSLGIFELTTEKDKFPQALSSGQYQRAILCKILVQNPDLVLLDEPFSHLDCKLKDELEEEFFNILKQKRISVFWATHNLEDALKYSSKTVVLNLGKIEQIDTPKNIYQRPKNIFVADIFPNSTIIYKNDGYYCYRPESIKVHDQGSKVGITEQSVFIGHHYLLSFTYQEHQYTAFHTENKAEISFDFDENFIYPISEI